jgi:Xaa-Pro aminopeptidase
MVESIVRRVEALRGYMRQNGLSAFVFPSTDPHCGEYVPAHWMTRQWISGFDGSAGTAVVTLSDAALWTDSRYFIAAEEQLKGTPFHLMKDGLPETPSITEWLGEKVKRSKGERVKSEAGVTMNYEPVVGMDGSVNTIADVQAMREELGKAGIQLRTDLDPAETLWEGRPAIPKNRVEVQPLEFAGETAESKIERVRQILREQHADGIVITQLDEIAWLLNLRGSDVHCNPVFVSYVLLTTDETTLFIDSAKLDDATAAYLQRIDVKTCPYKEIGAGCKEQGAKKLLIDPNTANYSLIQGNSSLFTFHSSPIPAMKAIKNAAEIEGFRQAMVRDGVAMVKFLHWLKPALEAGGETEMSIDRKLTALRAEQPLYRGLSFDTIAAYGPHGAIVHYEATPETDVPLEPRGLLLLDSGAQYQDGTTDITRTIALGPLTDEERLDYTLVLKGHIRLALTRFPDGISGTQIDALARYAMWQYGINYGHGTGHGVGSYLCVHEGPHQIRHTWKPAPLHAGMTVTNEPGIYRAGKHGVRIENTMLIVPDGKTEFGKFLRLEPLTLCPIDLTPVIWEMMTPEEVAYINSYHKKVYQELAPYLNEEERQWLS